MSAAIRGPATRRFYKLFHAWSKLGNGNVLHAQRPRFVTTASAHGTHKRQDSHVAQTPRASQDEPGVQTETPRRTTSAFVPGDRWERMQQHPTFLHRMQAALDVTVQPIGEPTPDGHRQILIHAPARHVSVYVRTLLRRNIQDDLALDNTVFEISKQKRNDAVVSTYQTDIQLEKATMLEESNEELKLRIQDTFSVQLALLQGPSEGLRLLRITGLGPQVRSAREFVESLQHLSEQSLSEQSGQPNEQQTSQPTTQPSSTDIKSLYKATMRSVPSSVVVLTSRVSSSRSDIDSLRGMTVSSLTSVTLDPEPIISFSIKRPSRTLECIMGGQPFNVHFLSPTPTGARIAEIFSTPHVDPSHPFRILRGFGWADICEHEQGTSVPFLRARHVLSRFTCETLPGKSVEIGDHIVVFARVTQIWRSSSLSNPPQGQPTSPTFLAYAQAAYRMLAPGYIEIDRSKTVESARSHPRFRHNKPTIIKDLTPALSDIAVPQPPQTETETRDSEVFGQYAVPDVAEPDADETVKREKVVDAYWRMALDEVSEDSVLEERAADQRALGEAQKPADHNASRPAASEQTN